jgi:VanZ family protein
MSSIPINKRHLLRIILWVTVILYTVALPYVILVFETITRHFSAQTAATIPLVMNILMAVAYVIAGVIKKRIGNCIFTLAFGAVIVFAIMASEANTNKHIHIPEYVLMTWLLYQAMIIDYKGRGILLLVFICASMLGVVDELLQGIHPLRTYGWKDMIIDAASSFIGILTLMGIKYPPRGDWSWIGHLKQYKALVAAILLGLPTTVLVCIRLFAVQARGSFGDVYPGWLLAGSGLFLIYTAAIHFFYWHHQPESGKFAGGRNPDTVDYRKTALLWIICPVVILISINLAVVWAAVAGVEFR